MIYFLPNCRAAQLMAGGVLCRSLLESRGLATQFADVRNNRQAAVVDLPGRGPGGLAGCLLGAMDLTGAPPRRWGFYPDEQVWHDIGEPGGPLWVGWATVDPPTPESLARPITIPGADVELADHQRWIVPLVRQPDGDTGLPQIYRKKGGEWLQYIADPCRALWDEAGQVFESLYLCGKGGTFPVTQALDFACHALALNYRLSEAEISLLGLLADGYFEGVVTTALGLTPELDPAQNAKKNDPATPDSGTGSPDATPDTDPAEPKSGLRPGPGGEP